MTAQEFHLCVVLGLVVLSFGAGCGTCEAPPQKPADPDAEQPIPFAQSRHARPLGVRPTGGDAGVDM